MVQGRGSEEKDMKNINSHSSPAFSARGFSLIEVLIAVVVISVGLLALASLQLTLIRSSSDTKTQSLATALAKQKLEVLLSYQTMGGQDNGCISPSAGSTNTCYRAIQDEASAAVDGDPSVAGNQPIGGVNFSRAVTVQRYVYDKSTGIQSFVLQGSDTALDSTLLTSPVTYLAGKEFKRIIVTTSWIDAAGVPRSVVTEDAINAIEPSDSAAVSKFSKGIKARKAKSIIVNPGSVAGVIPIAIGNGSDTAATNPRPIIVSQGQNSTTVETRFDVYTYVALNGGSATAQSRVETAVVGCKCALTNATHSANRPTFWDGSEYTTPTTAANIPVSAPLTGNSVTQSTLCTACCRDHFDPSGVAGEKFDPRRTPHNHYLASDLGTVVDASNPGNYSESCRLIRVDGVFYVATEPYDDHYGLLATPSIANSSSAATITDMVPATGTGSVSELYQTFVINYLKQRFVTTTGYNTVLDPTSVTGYSSLQTPATATIDSATMPQYMHSRGLLIDYLSAEALAAITKVKADCAAMNVILANSCPADMLQTNVLKVLPFTSINSTELAKWASSDATKIGVNELTDLSESIDNAYPASGKATYISGATNLAVTGTTTIQGTSAGLAITPQVFPANAYTGSMYSMSDTQPFQIGANASSGGGSTFYLNWLGGALASATLGSGGNAIATNMLIGSGQSANPPCSNHTTSYNDGNFDCSPPVADLTLPNPVPIRVSNYNRTAGTDKQVQNACNAGSPTTTTPMSYLLNYDVQSYTVNGGASVTTGFTVVNSNQAGASCANNGGECTSFTIANVTPNATVAVTFSSASYKCPSNWSTYLNTNGTAKAYPGNGNCNGNVTPKTPKWSSTYAADCPSGLTFP